MSDRAAVILAAAVAAGAWVAWRVPLAVGLVVVAGAFAVRRPALLIGGAFLLASALSARAWAGVEAPRPGEPITATAVLLSDPEWSRFGQLQVELGVGRRRVAASARSLPASRLVTRLAGERVEVEGRLRPLSGRSAAFLRRRHIVARLDLSYVGERPDAGDPATRIANHIRRLLDRGAESMSGEHRALFAGFLLGDDRGQSPVTVYDFRASGLSHLLAVSGQNVAFILAIAGPALRRLRLGGRLVVGAAVLALFGVLTRWEPTVLRAVAMAFTALIAATIGRPASSLRLLALAVAGLLLVDPLLVGLVSFQLTTAASAGIVLLAPILRGWLPGPRVIAEPVAVTAAAQLAVAPILVTTFDTVPVTSLPANLLAGPAAAPITMWGLVAGVVAGLGGDPWARLVHVPTRLLIGWVAGVASWSARLPLGDLDARGVGVLAVLVAIAVWLPRWRRAGCSAAAVVLVATALLPVLSPAVLSGGATLVAGARLCPSPEGAVVLVLDKPDPVAVLSALRQARIRQIDALVVGSASASTTEAVATITARIRTRVVVAADDGRLPSCVSSSASRPTT